MPPIYITEQGSKIRIQNNCIHIEHETENQTEILYRAPLGTVSQLVLAGNIGITTPAISAFLERQIDVVFLDSYGNFRGRLLPEADPRTALRRAQFTAADNQSFSQEMAVCLVRAKLRHQLAMLRRHNTERHDPIIDTAILKICQSEKKLDGALTRSAIRGTEGHAAAAYFSGYRQLFHPDWSFTARRKHPSPDPVNAMLSFGYTLLSQLAVSAVQVVGLDPYVGFLHEEEYNRPSLGLDLMEEFRPVVDGVILKCCHSGMITPADFVIDTEENSCMMNKNSRKIFIKAFEERMDERFTHPLTRTRLTLRQCLQEQARQIAACCRNAPQKPEFKAMGFR